MGEMAMAEEEMAEEETKPWDRACSDWCQRAEPGAAPDTGRM